MLSTVVLAARPVPSVADWWMVWLTAAATVGGVGALVALLVANARMKMATAAQLDIQRQEIELARQALDDERRARQEEIARIDAERRDAEAAQARLVSCTEPDVAYPSVLNPLTGEVLPEPGPVVVSVPVYNDSDLLVRDLSVVLDRHHPQGTTGRLVGIEARASRIEPHGFARLVFRGPMDIAHWDGGDPVVLTVVELTFTDAAGLRWRHRPGQTTPQRLYEASQP